MNLGILSQGWKLDFKRFRVYLKEKYHVEKAFLFLGYIKTNKKLYQYLERLGDILVFKDIITTKEKIKGNVDAELIVWVMKSIYENYCDQAIIVTEDGDFAVLINFLLDKNKLIKFITPNWLTLFVLIKKIFIKRKMMNLLESLNNKQKQLRSCLKTLITAS